MTTLRLAWRRMLRAPGFVAAIVVSLALGIGAATAMFSLTDALVLRPLAVRDPSRLVRLSAVLADGRVWRTHTPAVDLLQQDPLLKGTCGFLTPGATVEIEKSIGPVNTMVMTGGCFAALGIRPAIGRLLGPDDDRPAAARVVVLSYDEWSQRFNRDPAVVGRILHIEGVPFTIVGVAERGFKGVQVGFPAALFYTFTDQALLSGQGPRTPRESLQVEIVARIRDGVTMAVIEAKLRTLWPQLLERVMPPGLTGIHLDNYRRRQLLVTNAVRGVDYILRPRFERPLFALLGASGLVLLIVCVNLASLLLARAAEQRRDVQLRIALGAPRWTLIRDSLVESALMLALGTLGGISLAYWICQLLVATYGAAMVNFAIDVTPDLRVLGFASAVSALVFFAFAIGPAWSVSRPAVSSMNAESSRTIPARRRFRAVTIVVQVAVAIVLVSVGALFASTWYGLRTLSLGLTVDGIIGAQLAGRPGGYQNNFSGTPYYENLLQQINRLPGVRSSALSQPFVLSSFAGAMPISRPGREGGLESTVVFVSDTFFSALDIPLITGAVFPRTKAASEIRDVILSESLARALFATQLVIGESVRISPDPQEKPVRVVGVVRDAIIVSPQRRNLWVAYLNYWQLEPARQGFPSLLVRMQGEPASIMQAIERTVRDAGHEYVLKAATLEGVRDASLSQEQLLASLATAFAVVGLVLVAVGVYGLLSYYVAQRTVEIGVRVALGATPGAMVWLVVRDVLFLVGGGIALGVPACVLITQLLSSLLFATPSDGGRYAVAAVGVLLSVSLAAIWWPARRASRIDPAQALRRS